MQAGPLRDALTFLAGAGTGLLSGAFGIGGAVISTPAIRALGCSAALAVGTTLPSILPGAVTGFVRYRTQDLIDWSVVRLTVPAGFVASIGGSELAHVLPGNGHPLMIITAALLLFSAINLIRTQDSGETGVTTIVTHPTLKAGASGAAAGLLSGLLGIGGGVLLVPAFRAWLAMPLRRAIATSLVCVGFFAIPGAITHALNHDIEWRYALWLTVAVVPGARLGANLSMRTGDRRLRLGFGIFLGLVAVYYGISELAQLR